MRKGRPVVLAGLLVLVSLFAPASLGHTQQTLTVILTDDGVVAGNITDPAFVQGNIAWFRMEDGTNNTSMVVRVDVDMDGAFNASNDFESPVLTNTCELDENGSLVDDTCAVSSKYAFDMNASVGTYHFWVHRHTTAQKPFGIIRSWFTRTFTKKKARAPEIVSVPVAKPTTYRQDKARGSQPREMTGHSSSASLSSRLQA